MKRYVLLMFAAALAVMISVVPGADAKDLLVVAEENPPYEFLQSNKAVGINVDIASAIFKKIGVKAEFGIYPWKRAWYMIEKGEAYAVFSASRKPEREPFVNYPKKDMWSSKFVFFVKKSNKQGNTMTFEDAKNKKLKNRCNPGKFLS